MKIRKFIMAILLGFLALSLSGCFEVTEEYWINPDGSGKMHFEIGISEALLAMGTAQNGNKSSLDTDSFFTNQGIDNNNPYLKNVVTSQTSENDMRLYTIDADVVDFSKVFQTANDSQSGYNITFEKLPNGNLLIKRTLDLSKTNTNAANDSNSEMTTIDTSKLMGVMLAGRNWTTRLHSTQIVNTNGKWDKENHVVEWKMPMSELLQGKGQVEMTAEIRLQPPLIVYIMIGIGVLAFLILLAIIGLLIWKRNILKAIFHPNTPNPPSNVGSL